MNTTKGRWPGLDLLLLVSVSLLMPVPAQAEKITNRDTLLKQYHAAEAAKKIGQYAEAVRLYEQLVKAAPAILGDKDTETAALQSNLAELYRVLGQYARAEPLFTSSLAICAAEPEKNALLIANTRNNLGLLAYTMGQYARAEPLFESSRAIWEARLGAQHLLVAYSLNNQAALYEKMDKYDDAERLYQKSLRIFEDNKDDLSIATSQSNLAALYVVWGRSLYARGEKLDTALVKYNKAKPLYEGSLKIREDKLDKRHPEIATSCHNLAELYVGLGEYTRAKEFFDRSLEIREAQLGQNHPEVAQSRTSLATLYTATEHGDKAAMETERARRISRHHGAQVLPVLSEPEQLSFLTNKDREDWHKALSLGLLDRARPELAMSSAVWLLNGKAVAQETLAETLFLARDSRDPRLGEKTSKLRSLRQRLAHLTLIPPQPGQEQTRTDQIKEVSAQEQELAKQLRQAGSQLENERPDPWIKLPELRKHLPDRTALIDIAYFEVFDFQGKLGNKWGPAHYAAWITLPQGPVQLVDLGPAEPIDAVVRQVRAALETRTFQKVYYEWGEPAAEKALRQPLDALARLVLHPLLPYIDKCEHWLVSPDGNLWLVPWCALPLPDGKYAIEKHALSYVVSSRDLVSRRARPAVKPTAPLVLADPDFDLGLTQMQLETRRLLRGQEPLRETRSLSEGLRLGKIPRLPGTADEARAIAPQLKKYTGAEPMTHTGKQALATLVQAAHHPRILVLSTHGFFLPDQEAAAKKEERPAQQGRKSVKPLENPLLRCGLLLAGCNNAAGAVAGEDNGVLTGLHIVGTDLRGCELVVLSACETGLGVVHNGEGVAGLRQAFQLAGAESVVASLWQVDDAASADLMARFFDNLARGQSKSDALRQAQLALIKSRRDKTPAAHPYFWAAFTLTGR